MPDSEPLPLIAESACASGPGSVPVFNCTVILHTNRDTGRITGRAASLPDVQAVGSTEREVLMSVTRQFKRIIQQCLSENRPIPWLDPPLQASSDEMERFVPVHL